ncbi:hypothetical protein [Cohnella sp. JJ-181]|uniref:hypothetical protein n=1 Tax=Cohnella rhizoplanae TaxID=2974897 RepID=UPI0022FF7705|nr:hypothetical protein [Cohnella sp. JJ-181]CAI6086123.1 hypothetical protein COHCIP112018_04926 [Cohnella sp. JJ-181]
MNAYKVRRILNISALALLIAYFTGIIVMLATFKLNRFDDDFVFAFSFNYLLWGGVSLLIGVFVIMMVKLMIARE